MRISRRRKFYRRPEPTPYYSVNERIRAPELRVIDETGQNLGVMTTEKALSIAAERGYDLIEVSPKEVPPIAKLLNYGQFKYEKEKEARKQRAGQKQVELKGIRLSIRIDQHDIDVRKEQAKKFLERGDKLKIEIILRGRERQHADLAKKVLGQFIESLKQELNIKIEQPIAAQGGQVTSIVTRV